MLLVFLSSCKNDHNENVTLTKEEYKKLTGDTNRVKYPKIISIINNPDASAKHIEVYYI